MKTDNFKMTFDVNEGYQVTIFTFGYTKLTIRCYPAAAYGDKNHYCITYYNKGTMRFCKATYSLPVYLWNYANALFYGQFTYHLFPFQKSPAHECIAFIRSIQNYIKRNEKVSFSLLKKDY